MRFCFPFLLLFHDRASLVYALRCPSKLTVVDKPSQRCDATFSVLLEHQDRYVVHTFVFVAFCVHNLDIFLSFTCLSKEEALWSSKQTDRFFCPFKAARIAWTMSSRMRRHYYGANSDVLIRTATRGNRWYQVQALYFSMRARVLCWLCIPLFVQIADSLLLIALALCASCISDASLELGRIRGIPQSTWQRFNVPQVSCPQSDTTLSTHHSTMIRNTFYSQATASTRIRTTLRRAILPINHVHTTLWHN